MAGVPILFTPSLPAPGEGDVACLGVWAIIAQAAFDRTVSPALGLTLLFLTYKSYTNNILVLISLVLISSRCKGGLR